MCTDIFDHVFSDHLTSEDTHDFSAKENDLRGEVTHILYHLQDKKKSVKSILSCESGEMFMRFFKGYLVDVFDSEMDHCACAIPRDYVLNHIVSDFAETVRWWMKNEKYSPEEIAGFFWSTIPLSKETEHRKKH